MRRIAERIQPVRNALSDPEAVKIRRAGFPSPGSLKPQPSPLESVLDVVRNHHGSSCGWHLRENLLPLIALQRVDRNEADPATLWQQNTQV